MEDILWAKNRHLFGGLEPSNMHTFTATANEADDGTITVTIKAKGPGATRTPNGQALCVCEKVIIRKSTEGYPKDEFDGELVATVTDKNYGTTRTITDENVEGGKTYYYAAFPCSYQGVCNRNKANRAMVDLSHVISYTYFFGYDLDLDDSNPATRVTYPDDVDNANYNSAYMDFNAGSFNYGGWNITPGEKFMPRPCMLKYNGTVDHYLDPNDYTKRSDGSTSSTNISSFAGNAMMEWPKIYTKRWEENGIYHFRCSDVKIDDDWDCWCNYDGNNNEIDHFYTAIYRNYEYSNRSRSYSGSGVMREKSMSYERSSAQNNGSGWDLEVIADHLLIQDLLVMMGKSTNTQAVYGAGRESNTFVSTGSTNTDGLFTGAADGSKSLKVFGMEDWWGDLARRILGLSVYNGIMYAKITKGTKDGSTVNDYAVNSISGYTSCGKAITTHKYGYISGMITYPWGRLPSAFSGSSSKYECDYGHVRYSTLDICPAEISGSYDSTREYKGAFFYRFDYTSVSEPAWMSSRLSYKPTKS